jgi:hypothetical protein
MPVEFLEPSFTIHRYFSMVRVNRIRVALRRVHTCLYGSGTSTMSRRGRGVDGMSEDHGGASANGEPGASRGKNDESSLLSEREEMALSVASFVICTFAGVASIVVFFTKTASETLVVSGIAFVVLLAGIFGISRGKKALRRTLSFPVYVLLAVVIVVFAGGYFLRGPTPARPRSTGSACSTSTSPVVTTNHLPTYAVSRRSGFVANGAVHCLGADTLWLFDRAEGRYYIDVQAIVDPRAHTWSAPDRPLGSSSDPLPFKVTAEIVIASPVCTRDLQADAASGNTKMPNLPPGCADSMQPITVTVYKE